MFQRGDAMSFGTVASTVVVLAILVGLIAFLAFLKKKGKSFQIKTKSKNKGKVTYKSSSKYVKVSKKGKVTISKKAKKGTYKIKVTVAAKGNYGKCVKYIKIRVK